MLIHLTQFVLIHKWECRIVCYFDKFHWKLPTLLPFSSLYIYIYIYIYDIIFHSVETLATNSILKPRINSSTYYGFNLFILFYSYYSSFCSLRPLFSATGALSLRPSGVGCAVEIINKYTKSFKVGSGVLTNNVIFGEEKNHPPLPIHDQ